MKYSRSFVLGVLLAGLTICGGRAQDAVYFANDGSSVTNTRLTDAVNDKLVLTVQREGISRDYTFTRSRIALAFTKAGNYLLAVELDSDPAQARRQLQTFLTTPPRPSTYDFLVKTNPLTVIAAQVAYENGEFVNYVTSGGRAASINIHELTAILFHDGRHRLLAPAAVVAPLLAGIRSKLVDPASTTEPTAGQVWSSAQSVADPDSPTDTAPVTNAVVPTPRVDSSHLNLNTLGGNPSVLAAKGSVTPDGKLPTEDVRTGFRNQALKMIDEVTSYLNIITDQGVSEDKKDQAIRAVERLFLSDATIDVTSTRRSGSRQYSIREYLSRLKMVPYPSGRMSQVQTQFFRDPVQNPDGTYSCTTEWQQFFLATDISGKVIYTDLESRKIRIGPEQYYRLRYEQRNGRGRVLLGNVRLETD